MRKVERIDPANVDAVRLRDALASALSGGRAVALAPISHESVPDDIALIINTGGSSGEAKSVALSAQAMRASARLSNQALGVTPTDHWSLTLPLHHIAGINQLLRSIENGSEPQRGSGEFCSVVPTQLYRALRARDALFEQLVHAKKVLIGGAAVPKELMETGRSAGIPLVTSYGMTEMCGGCIYDGKALPGVEVQIRNGNRIALKGPMQAEGYLDDETSTKAAFVDGWFITSDIGRIDESGALEVHGRADDLIISGGEKISPTLVAEILRTHFPSNELLVLGIADPEWGQSLRLVMVTSNDESRPTLAAMRELVAGHLGKVAAPRSLLLLSDFPIKANGKIDLQMLASMTPTEKHQT